MYWLCPGLEHCREIGLENSERTCSVLGRYMVGTLSISLQCTCSVPVWYTTPCPQCVLFGVDDEDYEAEVVAEEVSKGESREATLERVDHGEDRGDVNIGMLSLVGLVSPCAFANLNPAVHGVSALSLDSLDEDGIEDDC